jgi:dienelactone hydrolase
MLTDWRFVVAAALLCSGVLMTCIETNAQGVPKEIASRVEIYAIPSVTISDQQFLTGDANGKPVTVAGELRVAPDDYNPVASCKAFVARLKQAGRDVALTEYPDSAHGFDAGLIGNNTIVESTGAQTVRHCHIKEGEGGLLMNADTQVPFTYKDACVELSPHVGGNPATAQEARKAVVEFLRELLKLG